nr:biotin--protein ligase 2-like isoform X2 [Ipomoea batatas]
MESESSAPLLLVLCGKSAVENELAKSLKNNNAMKLLGDDEVEVVLHPEVEDSLGNEGFRIRDYFNSLLTMSLGRFLVYSPRLPSTQDVVARNFCELPVGAVCVADVQFKGRGRSMNVWESPKGSLLFSFTLQMEDGRMVPHVQYVVSLAITDAINDLCKQYGIPRIDVRIKWPNDLYLGGLKVGGILCTSTYKSQKFNISAGIGINVDNEKPTTCLNAVLQKSTSVPNIFKREDIMAAFFNKFETFIDVFFNQGFRPLEELYYKTWLHSGQRVIVQEKTENQDQFVENVVTIQGLSSSGYLLAITDDGQTCELHPDGNSVSFKDLVASFHLAIIPRATLSRRRICRHRSSRLPRHIGVYAFIDHICRHRDLLEAVMTYDGIYASLFTYDRSTHIVQAFCEAWCLMTNTLLTSVDELLISLWDIHVLCSLPIFGDIYDEYVPTASELTGTDIDPTSTPQCSDSSAIIRTTTLAYWAMMSVESHLQRVFNVGVTLLFGVQDHKTQVHGDHLERHIKDLIPEPPVDMRQEVGTTKKDKCPVQEDESSPKNIKDTTSKQRVNVVPDSSDRDAC